MQKNALRPADIRLEEVPAPKCGASSVLLANRYSLISAGTEGATVRRNKRDMVFKAIRDPDIRQSVVEMVMNDGIGKTVDRVKDEMTKWTPLGYSGAGVAVEVGRDVEGIRPGGLVAYGGEGHAEYIRVSKNLCVPVPEGVSAKEAAFVALGSIALQAVRRAEIQVGDVVAVLGLGLVGQLVSQMAQAAGARVIGSDVIANRLSLAESLGLERGFVAQPQLPDEMRAHTDGIGADRVVICASTTGSQVVQQAVDVARDRGRIVVVGMVGLDVPCEEFYRKELDLVISRSYGPGRYDRQYEEHGIDYPIGYVRWTEKRNMQEFLRLVQTGRVNVKPLISHEFSLDEADQGYEMLSSRPSECLAVLLRYDETPDPPQYSTRVQSARVTSTPATSGNVAVIGCGGFARQFHLPNLKAHERLCLRTLVASTGQSAKEMAKRYGAQRCTTDLLEVWNDPADEAVMILTRDNSHARLTMEALEAGKHVFCEKPLATNEQDCRKLAEVAASAKQVCMVGFNRRFAPLMQPIQDVLQTCCGPKMISYRVNAGPLPKDDWVYDPVHAAGRIVGEACHFVDLFHWLTGAEPIRVSAHALGNCTNSTTLEDVAATFEFSDGSIASLLYTAAGSSRFPKERLEVFCDGTTVALDDFHSLTIRGKKRIDVRHRRADKGHAAELTHFADAVLGKAPPQTTHLDGIRATICCLKLLDSVKSGQPQEIDLSGFYAAIEQTRP